MLVLSRQKNQRIRFPGLGITIEILDVKGAKVRVGIDAPIEVRILRDELEDYGESPKSNLVSAQCNQPAGNQPHTGTQPHTVKLPQDLRHDLRNVLNELNLMLQVYKKRSEKLAGPELSEIVNPEQMFQAIIERLENLGASHDDSPKKRFDVGLATVDNPGQDSAVIGDALIVDDDENERELLAGFLRMCNYKVHIANDGLEGVKFLQTNPPPRVILLDMNMPRCSGREFLLAVRLVSVWDPIPVFVISGKTPEETRLNPGDGYTHWFSKPLNPSRVVEELAKIEASKATFA